MAGVIDIKVKFLYWVRATVSWFFRPLNLRILPKFGALS